MDIYNYRKLNLEDYAMAQGYCQMEQTNEEK